MQQELTRGRIRQQINWQGSLLALFECSLRRGRLEMPLLEKLFLLIAGHALGDFILQSEAMGSGKNRNDHVHTKQESLFPVWYYWLSAHALVHGGIVFLITNNLLFGVIETLLHWMTDFAKCEGWIGMHQDQGIHIGCKVGYSLFS